MKVKDHLNKIPVFESVCRLRSFSLAAHELHLSQPAVSKIIASLESGLGFDLILRSRNGVFPTKMGLKLFEISKEILGIAEKFDHHVRVPDRVLRIGTKEPIATHLMPGFLTTEPDRRTDLVIGRSNAELLTQLLNGEVNLLLVPESKFPPNVRCSKLFLSRWGAYSNPKAESKNLIIFPETIAGKGRLEDYIKVEKDDLRVQSLEAALTMAAKGLGIAILPSWMTSEHLKLGLLIEERFYKIPNIPETKICAVTLRPDAFISSAVTRLRSYCRSYI